MDRVSFDTLDDLSAVFAVLPADLQALCVAVETEDGHDLTAPANRIEEVQLAASDMQAARRAGLRTYAANKRWQVETGGITVGGATVDTSRNSQAMITGAYSYSQAHPEEVIRFKAASGWTTLDAATLATIATAVGAHVQACFAVEATLDADIEAGTIKTQAQIEAANWP